MIAGVVDARVGPVFSDMPDSLSGGWGALRRSLDLDPTRLSSVLTGLPAMAPELRGRLALYLVGGDDSAGGPTTWLSQMVQASPWHAALRTYAVRALTADPRDSAAAREARTGAPAPYDWTAWRQDLELDPELYPFGFGPGTRGPDAPACDLGPDPIAAWAQMPELERWSAIYAPNLPEALRYHALTHPEPGIRTLVGGRADLRESECVLLAADPALEVRVQVALTEALSDAVRHALVADTAAEVREVMAGRSDLTPTERAGLAQDPDDDVRVACVERWGAQLPLVLLQALVQDSAVQVRRVVASDPRLEGATLERLVADPDAGVRHRVLAGSRTRPESHLAHLGSLRPATDEEGEAAALYRLLLVERLRATGHPVPRVLALALLQDPNRARRLDGLARLGEAGPDAGDGARAPGGRAR